MHLKKVGSFNDVPQELLDKVPILKTGKSVFWRHLNGQADAKTGHKFFGSKRTLPLRDTIKDPASGRFIEIGVPKAIKDNKVEEVEKYIFGKNNGGAQLNEKFELIGGNIKDEELHVFLWLSNKNLSNPNRDPSVLAEFEWIDTDSIKKRAEKEDDEQFKAMDMARQLGAPDQRIVASILKQPVDSMDPADVAMFVKQYAKANPKAFIALVGDSEQKLKGELAEALRLGVITYDQVGHRILSKDGKTLATLTKDDSRDEIQLFADWISTSKDGAKVSGAIKKAVSLILKPEEGSKEGGKDEE